MKAGKGSISTFSVSVKLNDALIDVNLGDTWYGAHAHLLYRKSRTTCFFVKDNCHAHMSYALHCLV